MELAPLIDAAPLYASGLATTLQLLVAALAFGLALALPLGVARASSHAWWSWPVAAYTFVIRGTPMLVQLFIIYYGLAQFDAIRESVLWIGLESAWFCAVLALALNTAAYTAEIVAGAIRATPAGEIEAAYSLGMTRQQAFVRIVLPSALKRALPAYSNEVIMMLHATSLASLVTLVDLTGAARDTYSRTYLPFEAYVTAGLVYLGLTLLLVRLFRRAEARWLQHLAARPAT
ncbi:MAG: ABC transporter permease subunit [Betaproteobacteria bacterium]|nr:ABC transporter permease subunit [Betaproteobacteria bacterium]